MAHFAKIENGIVQQVIVISDKDCPDEKKGINFIKKDLGLNGTWIKTSYSAKEGSSFRKNFAGIGYAYNRENDLFCLPKPFESWKLDKEKGVWKAPKKKPVGKDYKWNEKIKNWQET